jgi:segregation and condensation protein B
MNPAELKGALEAIIYAADEPATLEQLVKATGVERDVVRAALDEMIAACASDERGIEIRRVARGYRFSTKPQHHEVVRTFIKGLRPPLRLSMPALETLAVIAYKQPITLPEIQEIRGVNCSGVIQTLLEKHLVTTAGRKAVIGRPILYRITKEFLMRFGLNDVDELPSLKEFEQLAREALGPDAGIEMGPEPEDGAGEGELAVENEASGGETEVVREVGAEDNVKTGAGEESDELAGTGLGASGTPAESGTESEAAGEGGEEIAAAVAEESGGSGEAGAEPAEEEDGSRDRSQTP